jgi:hypothetical protein
MGATVYSPNFLEEFFSETQPGLLLLDGSMLGPFHSSRWPG